MKKFVLGLVPISLVFIGYLFLSLACASSPAPQKEPTSKISLQQNILVYLFSDFLKII